MLFIDKDASNIITAKETHINKVSCRIRVRLFGKKCDDFKCEICAARSQKIEDVPEKLKEILRDDAVLLMILGSDPEGLYLMSEMVWAELVTNFSWNEYKLYFKAKAKQQKNRDVDDHILVKKYHELYNYLVRIFDYDVWFQNGANSDHYDAYQLAGNLDRNTCTYCNRMYTSTMKSKKDKKVMRPTFDHWYSHAKHPLLGLSFYNLIPSCSVCNSSIKGFKEYTLSTHLHPYVDKDCMDQFSYSYDFFKGLNKFDIKIKSKPNSPKAFKTYDDLKLRDIYNAHRSELADLLRIKEAYSTKYIDNMVRSYSTAGLSHKEIYRLAFGAEFEEKNFYKRPLSKFKKDILSELKLLDIFVKRTDSNS